MNCKQYILEFTFSLIECSCKVSLTNTPDNPIVDKVYLFSEVGNISVQRYHQPDDTLGDFNGFQAEELANGRTGFRIDTGDSIVIFEACTVHDVSDGGKNDKSENCIE